MIIGVIPVGGLGSRLGLPFSKEMLPQRGYLYYNPIINHLVQKMLSAGAEEVLFIHGPTAKKDIKGFFAEKKFKHILQKDIGFSKVLKCLHEHIKNKRKYKDSTILFGLPDVYFNGNPFFDILKKNGVVCGLFKTDNETMVDRLNEKTGKFDIKTPKTKENSDFFWGVIKFDYPSFHKSIISTDFSRIREVGLILNRIKEKSLIYFDDYIDIGTWKNLNIYWKTCDSAPINKI